MVKVVDMDRHKPLHLGIITNIVIAVIFLTNMSLADIPQVINYQGRLTDSIGLPVPDGRHEVQFKIWTTLEGPGFVLWDSGPQNVDTKNGLFTYLLGSNVPMESNLFSTDTTRWLGITVNDSPEGLPRAKLTSSPYAYHALRSDTAGYAATPVIVETRTVIATTVAAGPDEGKVTVTFDSTFTKIPIVQVMAVLRGDSGDLVRRDVVYVETIVTAVDFTITVRNQQGGSLMPSAQLEITYLALQIGQ